MASIQTLSSNVNITIDNSANSYFFRFESGSADEPEIRLYGVKVEYEITKVQ